MRTRLLVVIAITIIVVLGVWAIFNTKSRDLFLSKQEVEKTATTWSGILNLAIEQEAKGNLLEAKSLYMKLVRNFSNNRKVGEWQRRVWDLNLKLLFSPIVTPGSALYEIKSGDSLAKIAKSFNTTVELLKRSNGLSSDIIIPGRKLKVWTKPFNIVIDKSQNILILKSDDEIINTYIVSTGINNSTPVGNFKINNKLVNPTWYKPGAAIPPESPDNILGSHWMGLNHGKYGIHGTTDNKSIGKQITDGCVRMRNSDVEELFTIVPVGTKVTIID